MKGISRINTVWAALFVIMTTTALLASNGAAFGCVKSQHGRPYSQWTFFSLHDDCSFCHVGQRDASGHDVSIADDWQGTMMANAALDPLWRAQVSSEVLNNPHIGSVIQQRCSRCHMPMANEEARIKGRAISIFDDGFLNYTNPMHALAVDGVSCSLCHQIQTTNLGREESFTGGFRIDEVSARPDRPAFGPYGSPFQMPMRRMSGFSPFFGSQSGQSEMCATCHTVFVPFVDKEGKIVGTMPEQTPYLEWKASSFGDKKSGEKKSCQGCHMPAAEGGVAISRMPRCIGARSPFGVHTFTGANVFSLSMLKRLGRELGASASDAEFDSSVGKTILQLQQKTADVRIENMKKDGDSLYIVVRVVNKTGHKFPTGIPLRRAWVHIAVTDSGGNVVFESGRPNKDGSIEGNDADRDLSAFEPHRDIIDNPDDVQIYEEIEMDTEGAVTYVFLKGAEHIKDNRLLPLGFDKTGAPAAIIPHGNTLTDENFTGGSDLVTYVVHPVSISGSFTVKARVLYQTISFAAVKNLSSSASKSQFVERFTSYYGEADKAPIVIASTTAELK